MIQLELRRKIAIYVSVMSLFIVSLYNVIRAGLEFQWFQSITTLGFALFLFNFPIIFIEKIAIKSNVKLIKDENILTFALLFIICLLGWLSIKTSYFFILLGFFSFFINFILFTKTINRYDAISLFFVLILSIWICIKVWEGDFTHPLLLEVMPFDNRLHLDTWFHISIAQMIKTYQIPSTGLNGIPFIPYHFGSHLIFACLSKTLNIHMFSFYQLAFPVIFIILFIKVVMGLPITWAERHSDTYQIGFWFWLVLTFSLIGIFPNGILQDATSNWNTFAISESYSVSLIFLFFIFHILISYFPLQKESNNFKIIICIIGLFMIFMIGLSKISTLFMLNVVLSFLVIRLQLYHQKSIVYLFSIIALLSIGCLVITMDQYSFSTLEPFHFFKNYVKLDSLSFVVVYFFWSILLILTLLILLKFENSLESKFFYRVLIGTVLVICIIGFIPGALLNINGGSAAYFMDIHLWFSVGFILIILPRFINLSKTLLGSLAKTTQKVVIILGTCLVLYVGLISFKNFRYYAKLFIRNTYITYNWIGGNHIGDDTFVQKVKISVLLRDWKNLRTKMDSNLKQSPDYKALRRLYLMDTLSLDEKSKTILVVRDVSQISKKYPCSIYPFLIPALTGRALKDGYIYEQCESKNYSYEYYKIKALQYDKLERIGISKRVEIKINEQGVTLNPLK